MKFNTAVCQIKTETETADTLSKVRVFAGKAADMGADFFVLPEMFECPYSGEFFARAARAGHGETVGFLSALARELNIYIIGGSVVEIEGDRLYNTCFVFDRSGKIIARHRKAHLFDVDLPDMRFKESDTFTAGNEITVFDTEFGKMGAAICFDVRFPELFRAMASRGARAVFLPAQFNTSTGPAHWDITLRARAVDNQFFFVAASAARNNDFSYKCWGHSMIIDPFGTVLAQADETEQMIFAQLDTDRIDQVRAQLPTFDHLRTELYEVAR